MILLALLYILYDVVYIYLYIYIGISIDLYNLLFTHAYYSIDNYSQLFLIFSFISFNTAPGATEF
jgi:hypothetical protein